MTAEKGATRKGLEGERSIELSIRRVNIRNRNLWFHRSFIYI